MLAKVWFLFSEALECGSVKKKLIHKNDTSPLGQHRLPSLPGLPTRLRLRSQRSRPGTPPSASAVSSQERVPRLTFQKKTSVWAFLVIEKENFLGGVFSKQTSFWDFVYNTVCVLYEGAYINSVLTDQAQMQITAGSG